MLGFVAPEGTDVNHTLCGARESWSSKVTVVPDGTVTVEGSKFLPDPEPWGIMIIVAWALLVLDVELELVELVVEEDEVVELVVLLVLLVLLVDVVEDVVLLLVLEVVEDVVMEDDCVVLVVVLVDGLLPGLKMKYPAPATSITTITAATTAPVPIPYLWRSKFMPLKSPACDFPTCFKRLRTPRPLLCDRRSNISQVSGV